MRIPGQTLDDLELAEPGLRHRRDERIARGLLVVPGERDLPHQVRVRALETVVAAQRRGEPVDAPLAADARDVQGVVGVGI